MNGSSARDAAYRIVLSFATDWGGMEDIGHLVAGLEQFVRAYGAAAVLVIIMLEAFGMARCRCGRC